MSKLKYSLVMRMGIHNFLVSSVVEVCDSNELIIASAPDIVFIDNEVIDT